MKIVSRKLAELLKSRCDLSYTEVYEITTTDGLAIRTTTGDKDIVFNSKMFYAGNGNAPLIGVNQLPEVSEKLGLSVDTLMLDLLGDKFLVNNQPFISACIGGLLDSARVRGWRLFMPEYGNTSLGGIPKLVGIVSDVEIRVGVVSLTVSNVVELLNVDWPRNLYQGGCLNSLGDDACGVDLAKYTTTCRIENASTRSVLYTSLNDTTQHPYRFGQLVFTSGLLTGVKRSVRADNVVVGSIELTHPLPIPPSVGDAFSLTMGCSKSYTDPDGCVKFANMQRFRGMPFIPTVEMGV